MPPAANLQAAAEQSYSRLLTLLAGGTMKAKLTSFCQTTLALFPQQEDNSHPASNWVTVLYSTTNLLPAEPSITFGDLNICAGMLYRLCWMVNQLDIQSLITSTQATATLTAYNANF